MTTRLVSVLLPVFNGEKFLLEALNSILKQSYKNLEVIIINDGSTDDSEEIIARFSDSRIRYLKNEQNMGLIASLNRGLEECSGEFIARLDADDIMHPDRISKQVEYLLKYPDVGVVGSHWTYIDSLGKIIGEHKTYVGKIRCSLLSIITGENPVGHPAVTIRSSVLKDMSVKYGDFRDAEDLHLWFELLGKGVFFDNVPENLIYYRVHTNQVSNKRKETQAEMHIAILHWFYTEYTGRPVSLEEVRTYYSGLKKKRSEIQKSDLRKIFEFKQSLIHTFLQAFTLTASEKAYVHYYLLRCKLKEFIF